MADLLLVKYSHLPKFRNMKLIPEIGLICSSESIPNYLNSNLLFLNSNVIKDIAACFETRSVEGIEKCLVHSPETTQLDGEGFHVRLEAPDSAE